MNDCFIFTRMQGLPEYFIKRIRKQYPTDADALIDSMQTEPKTSVHIHPTKGVKSFEGSIDVPWFGRGKILEERPVFTLDPLFHGGSYYPQESSSMFLHYVLEQIFLENRNITCLDLCASPGGKSILISSFLGREGRLIANEVIRPRNSILRENLTKWGADNTIVTCNDPSDFSQLEAYFDCVLVDAPCSGEGMFRKDKNARDEWSPANVQLCAMRQKRILEDVGPSIKPGGYLLYSTCTFAPEENELQLESLMATGEFETVDIAVPEEWQIHRVKTNSAYGLQFLPHRIQGEGFFIAVLKRKESNAPSLKIKPKPVFGELSKQEKVRVKERLHLSDQWLIKTAKEDIYASPFPMDEMNRLVNFLYITLPGVELGEFVKDDLIPAHALALSTFHWAGIQPIEVDEGTALQYLRGEAINVEGDKGWTIISFKNVSLGWIKILGNRTNNYYPKEWRIRMR